MKGGFGIIWMAWVCSFPSSSFGQVFINDAGAREKHFVYEVKQIDEFFERFNDDKDSFIRKVYDAYNVKYTIKRADLIKALFNYETSSWNPAVIDSFVIFVADKNNPHLLNFYGNAWFAEALCRFQYRSSEIEVPLVLKLDADKNKSSKWLIVGIRGAVSFPSENMSEPTSAMDNKKFIHPASHTNNFISLGKALEDTENLSAFFEKGFFTTSNGRGFYHVLQNGSLKLLYVKSVSYHFLQVPGWVFTVRCFTRKSLNSGWLINSLNKTSDLQKKEYMKALIGKVE